MNQYFVIALMFVVGFSMLYVPYGYSLDNRNNNSYTYYEKNCSNDACVVTTCSIDKPCSTTGVNNSTSNNTKEQVTDRGNFDSRTLELMNFWKNFMDFEQ
ncbi:hypothetical protein [Candidatus Nitrosocosmicus hydrocola]|uniref:hypothetical protein n=1 Tax=Candidatus Nitrosocosmicus hydrocola TaxID=1826872 RepID=UPI0011E5E78C|nr:hypothetical protein [Candidatus Nitrosocosmicus hydrocola]